MRILFLALAAAGYLLAQVPAQDRRNVEIPNTDTHFRAQTYTSLEQWEARKAALKPDQPVRLTVRNPSVRVRRLVREGSGRQRREGREGIWWSK